MPQQHKQASAILRKARKFVKLGQDPTTSFWRVGHITLTPRPFRESWWRMNVKERLRVWDLAIALAECAEGKRYAARVANEFGLSFDAVANEIFRRKRLLADLAEKHREGSDD